MTPFRLFLPTFLVSISQCSFSSDSFSVRFSRQNASHVAGEFVEADVIYNCKNDDPRIDEIEMYVQGLCKTVRRRCDECDDVVHTSSHQIFHHRELVYYPNSNVALRVGHNAIPFKTWLSAGTTPSSFEGHGGFVRYSANVTVTSVDGQKHRLAPAYFNVVNATDLSVGSKRYEKATVCERRVRIAGNEVTVRMELPKIGWIYGEPIPVNVDVDNKSSWVLEKILGDVVMVQKTFTKFAKSKDVSEFWGNDFTAAEAVLKNFTVATGTASGKKTSVVIEHKKKSFIPTIEPGWFPMLEVAHFVTVSVQFSSPTPSGDIDVPASLGCEFPVTFGTRKGLKVVPQDASYQKTFDDVSVTPSYPSSS